MPKVTRRSEALIPPVGEGQVLELKEMTATERFTKAAARYTEASLVKKLEELGIGRPSTYAPTISTIQSAIMCLRKAAMVLSVSTCSMC